MSDAPPAYYEKNNPAYSSGPVEPQGQQAQYAQAGSSSQQQTNNQPVHQQPQQVPQAQHRPVKQQQFQHQGPQSNQQGGQPGQQTVVVQHHNGIPPKPKRYGGFKKFWLYLLCFFFPPLSVIIVSPQMSDFWIDLLLMFLLGFPAIIHGIYIVHKYTSGDASYEAWERTYGRTTKEEV